MSAADWKRRGLGGGGLCGLVGGGRGTKTQGPSSRHVRPLPRLRAQEGRGRGGGRLRRRGWHLDGDGLAGLGRNVGDDLDGGGVLVEEGAVDVAKRACAARAGFIQSRFLMGC